MVAFSSLFELNLSFQPFAFAAGRVEAGEPPRDLPGSVPACAGLDPIYNRLRLVSSVLTGKHWAAPYGAPKARKILQNAQAGHETFGMDEASRGKHRIKRQGLHETLADSLRERILNGEFKEGEQTRTGGHSS
jgi:hypothetical protein